MTLEQKIDEMKIMVNDIHNVVLGPEHEKDNGLLSRVRDLETKFEKQSMFQKKLMWVAIGMGFPASWGLLEILQKIILK